MATTIQVSETTRQALFMLEERKKLKTHDDAIKYLLDEKMPVPKSMFGAAKGLSKWTKEDRAEFREL